MIVDERLRRSCTFRGQTGSYLEPPARRGQPQRPEDGARGAAARAAGRAARGAHASGSAVAQGRLRVTINGRQVTASTSKSSPSDAPRRPPLPGAVRGRAQAARATPRAAGAGQPRRQRNEATRADARAASWRDREYLQSIIQELEAANEELQSANEEILSSNEELQSTNEELETAKEELQSTNEELNTLNEELQERNEELSRVNSDLLNLLASVQIPIVMVSRDLRIRRFTPDGGEGAEPHPVRRRPAHRPHQAEHRLPRPRGADQPR